MYLMVRAYLYLPVTHSTTASGPMRDEYLSTVPSRILFHRTNWACYWLHSPRSGLTTDEMGVLSSLNSEGLMLPAFLCSGRRWIFVVRLTSSLEGLNAISGAEVLLPIHLKEITNLKCTLNHIYSLLNDVDI
jgi:hypothetical protein